MSAKKEVAQTHVAEWKKNTVQEIATLCQKYPIIGVLNMESLPSGSLQQMRSKLRGTVDIVMTRRSLLTRGFAKAKKPGSEQLQEYINKGMPALLFTKENPFTLYKTLKKSKTRAAAKPGQIAPYDLVIPAGPTPFSPGPVISEFAQIGVKAGVEGGKVAVKQEAIVCKSGEPVKPNVASMLARLGIEPMEIGLNLVAVYEAGTIYLRDVLDIDETQFMQNLLTAISSGINLAVEAAILTQDTTDLLIGKAYNNAKAVCIDGGILAPEVADDVLSSVERTVTSIMQDINIEEGTTMEYVYAAMLIHKSGGKVDEATVKKVLEASGKKPDDARVKALVASLQGVNIDEAVKKAAAAPVAVAAAPASGAPAKKEEEKKKPEDEKKSEEAAAAGLSALFG